MTEETDLPLVCILLSTYNGELYIAEQLDSLLRQDYPNIQILIRDDGSTDNTRSIVQAYSSNRIQVIEGNNLGIVRSFFELLTHIDNAEYIAFCDQDDIWLPHKISKAVSALEANRSSGIPALYCSRLTLVDRNLEWLGHTPIPRREPSLANALLENIATGCTIMINRQLRSLLLQNIPDFNSIRMHDRWFYQVASAFGNVIFDTESSILYRQHANNAIGASSTLRKRWLGRIKKYRLGEMKFIRKQAHAFYSVFGPTLTEPDRNLLLELLTNKSSWASRLQYLFTGQTYRQNKMDHIIFRLVLASGIA